MRLYKVLSERDNRGSLIEEDFLPSKVSGESHLVHE